MSGSKKDVRGKRCFTIRYYIRIYEKKGSKRIAACEMRYDKSGAAEPFLAATLYLNKNKGNRRRRRCHRTTRIDSNRCIC